MQKKEKKKLKSKKEEKYQIKKTELILFNSASLNQFP